MGRTSIFSGPGCPSAEVDTYINTSYDTVKKVADNLDLISSVIYSEEADALREAMVDAQSILDATNADVVLTNTNVSLTNADAAATAANLAAIEDVFGQFDELYLGAKDIPPTVDNNGDPLIVGAVYWDIPASTLMFYTGVSWVAPDGLATDAAERAEAAAATATEQADIAIDAVEGVAEGQQAVIDATAELAANVAITNADVVSTNAAVVSTNADVVTANNILVSMNLLFNEFDDMYLGAHADEPTTDNDGDPLKAGAIFWDTTTESVKFYSGSVWKDPDTSATNAGIAAEASAVTSTSNAVLTAADAVSTADDRIVVEALAAQYETITVSDVPPAPEDGVDGDIWFLIP